MLNQTILLKTKQRINKLDSNDYDNIQDWQIVEAFCKSQVDWCRRNLHGTNIKQEGDEQSTRRVDDLQVLIVSTPLTLTNRQTYYESTPMPTDYLQFKRVSGKAKNECCPPRPMVIYLAEQGNLDELLRDKNKQPSFDWGETFCTLKGNKVQVYTNELFIPIDIQLTYYRQPIKIQITGVVDLYTGITPLVDVQSEFKDDLIELLIDETVKILSGDIESGNQVQREGQATEENN